ncbi:hypothetical protein EYC84_000405 [Monilinia fructicola]|uniref:Uncharacterized protein n=1 Tax=Monilinia fructicola TaxID=38448 RepID=A0A5M9JQX5_MONFR|nr:hypothetical protein EYC84_000405 [Monilinia fructicola]
MSDLHKQLRRPNIQRSVFSFAKTSPTDLLLVVSGFQATLPEASEGHGKKTQEEDLEGRKLLDNASEGGSEGDGPPSICKVEKRKGSVEPSVGDDGG